ncbi:RNase P subunit p30-domain-containing protein [Lipomyces chichibuensis]|uniref:RNase P subunit p30-domain-containing protein n=1 Tax=Lipomyces chichibuensis TaxID=1546026 RepID=UPI0033431A83
MFYDLCVPWPKAVTASSAVEYTRSSGPIPDLFRTVATLQALGYTTIAYDYELSGKIGSNITSPIQEDVFSASLPKVTFLSRITILLDDAAQSQALPSLTTKFDILAVRPTTEKLLLAACTSLDIDLISLDLSQRLPFYLRHRTLGAAVARGIKIEICYSPTTRQADNNARRNLISNAAALFRATRGKGIIISSGATSALECRGPYDVANLATLWGFTQEKGKAAVAGDARAVVVHARMRRRSYKQVVEIVVDEDELRATGNKRADKKELQKRTRQEDEDKKNEALPPKASKKRKATDS